MPRLGAQLIAAGLLEHDKLEQALRAQVVWGGRLGTNLIELGFIDLDELSRALGRQHNLPAALARHFEKADPALQQQLSAELADRHSFVPILRLADNKVALAGMDPLDGDALAEIAAALKCTVDDLVVSVAAEQRMRYQLERVYGIARSARYLRSRGTSIPPFPEFGDFEVEADSNVDAAVPAGADVDIDFEAEEPAEIDIAIPIEWDEAPEKKPEPRIAKPRVNTDALEALIEQAASASPPPRTDEPTGAARRRYVHTLADSEPAPAPPPPKENKAALGRIAIRKVARTPAGGTPAATDDGALRSGTLADAARAIRRGPHRERVADLVIQTLERFAPNCVSAVLLIVRGETASGWRHFTRTGATIPELAVPLDQPGLVPKAVERAQTMRGKASELSAIDKKLLAALAKPDGDLAIVPVALAGRVLCVIAVATTSDAPIPDVETVATSAGTAFGRLMRDAGR